ncbi:MAG TPA: M14 family zinc carboxypeptidase, partial [Bacteroidales bacterium]|nr:M14 family zinc carboxypeptidase [Bacteroidales bacterium]
MLKKLLIPLLIFSFLAELCHSQIVSNDTKLRGIIAEKGQAEVIISGPGRQTINRLTRNYSIRSVRDKSIHILLSPLTVEKFIAEGYEYQLVERTDNKGVISSASIAEVMQWDSYPTYSQYDSIMRFLASSYPALCVLDTIGKSINGRLVLVLKISDNCKTDETEPEVFYTSSIHGDETAGFILMLRLSEYLLKNYSLNNRVKNLVDNLEIWINPLANPDGTYRNSNYILSPVRFNANGYDLNRNFPDPDGPVVKRQKETLDMMRFLADRRFVLSA